MTDKEFFEHLDWLKIVGDKIGSITVGKEFIPKVLDLINRQKAEIDKWKDECGNQSVLWARNYESIFETAKETIRAEAITEFEERLKDKSYTNNYCEEVVRMKDVDQIAKEMKGDKQ